jgi:glycine betaine/proline transport system ATP-binding protein
MSAAPAAIELKHVWKVFGPRAREAMDAITDESLGKAQELERFGCAVGVADVAFPSRPARPSA